MRDAATLPADELAARLESLRRRAGGDGAPAWWARARYAGQGHELSVPVTPGDDGETLARNFAALHASRIGFALDRPVEVVSVRFAATAPGRAVRLARGTGGGWDPGTMVDDGGAMRVELGGPASVSLPDATMFVAPRWRARALPEGGWLLERDG
jgi:N-methylhydantoinase A